MELPSGPCLATVGLQAATGERDDKDFAANDAVEDDGSMAMAHFSQAMGCFLARVLLPGVDTGASFQVKVEAGKMISFACLEKCIPSGSMAGMVLGCCGGGQLKPGVLVGMVIFANRCWQ
ncbi:hypothetical protein ACA910_007745 [Epithemia clementina (nom. ined.)]